MVRNFNFFRRLRAAELCETTLGGAPMAFSHIDRAQILVEALPYIQKFHGKTVVIKYGGIHY